MALSSGLAYVVEDRSTRAISEHRDLAVEIIDAIDGTPVIDIKRHHQPAWVSELMSAYWARVPT